MGLYLQKKRKMFPIYLNVKTYPVYLVDTKLKAQTKFSIPMTNYRAQFDLAIKKLCALKELIPSLNKIENNTRNQIGITLRNQFCC